MLYERALVLASGMLPERDKNYKWLKYTNISNELVQQLAEKLNLQLGRFNMHDLVGAYERMNRVYQWYIESAFPLRYEALNEERRKLLSQQGVLSQPPLLETIPVYPYNIRGYNLTEISQLLPPDLSRLSVSCASFASNRIFNFGNIKGRVFIRWLSTKKI